MDADVVVMTSAMLSAGDLATHGAREVRGSILAEALVGAWGRMDGPMRPILLQ